MNTLIARRLGIDTQDEAIAFLHADSPLRRSEGFASRARVCVSANGNSVIATLYTVTSAIIGPGDVGLSEAAWRQLGFQTEGPVGLHHPQPLESLRKIRGKIFGKPLSGEDFHQIISDVVSGRYSDIHVSSFVTACAARPLALEEMIALTRAMIDTGDRLTWPSKPVMDKHCIGGLPGNRTTPVVVAIVAACGLVMPKTSSRAITSPSGTADTMETMAPVDLDLPDMRRVVEREGACIVWGGAVRLSPSDDLLIRVERALDLDGEGQLVASVLSKKIAAGASHIVLDLPIGPSAKIRTVAAASLLGDRLIRVAAAFGVTAHTVFTDGSQPVGRGMGPALEARDVLAVLQGAADAPADLRERSVRLAGALLEIGGAAPEGQGERRASQVLADGSAWRKFLAICEAQGGLREPPVAEHSMPILASRAGLVAEIDNRRIASVAKLAGAPDAKAAGVEIHARLGERIEKGQPLYTIHAESRGELTYAGEYAEINQMIFEIR